MTNKVYLTQIQTQSLLKRFSHFELSYETIAHKKVFDSYNIGLAIPNGKKFFAWFTFYNDKDVCYIMEINREKKITSIQIIDTPFDKSLSLGTILYGTIVPSSINSKVEDEKNYSKLLESLSSPLSTPPLLQNKEIFLIEEIYYFKGIHLKNMTFGEKLGYIEQLFIQKLLIQRFGFSNLIFALPFIWCIKQTLSIPSSSPEFSVSDTSATPPLLQTLSIPSSSPRQVCEFSVSDTSATPPLLQTTESDIFTEFEQLKKQIPYIVHHIQLRQLTKINPYLNIPLNTILSRMNQREKEKSIIPPSICIHKPKFTMDYNKPQYKYPTVFKVIPDIQYDIYHLYAYGKNKESIYYNTAYIPNIEKSVFMNNLFRNIRENKNLDYIEESDDEEDFETIALDKYVDLNKVYNISCIFNQKFKRWVPYQVVSKETKIVHISKLVNENIL